MKTRFNVRFYACFLAFLVLSCLVASADAVPVLHTKTESYANVTLISRTATHVFVQHSRGVATIKLADLDASALAQLGVNGGGAVKPVAAGGSTTQVEDTPEAGPQDSSSAGVSDQVRQSMAPVLALIAGVWLVTLGVALLLYVFYIILVRLICKKAGFEPGWWIWVPFPVIQRYALLKAAGMSWLWILGTIVLNAIAGVIGAEQSQSASLAVLLAGIALFVTEHVIWSVKISRARGKGVATMIFLIFPLTFPFAFLYLAFSGGDASADAEDYPPVKSVQTEPIPA